MPLLLSLFLRCRHESMNRLPLLLSARYADYDDLPRFTRDMFMLRYAAIC